jgi:hypothetical protein
MDWTKKASDPAGSYVVKYMPYDSLCNEPIWSIGAATTYTKQTHMMTMLDESGNATAPCAYKVYISYIGN